MKISELPPPTIMSLIPSLLTSPIKLTEVPKSSNSLLPFRRKSLLPSSSVSSIVEEISSPLPKTT